ncbi:Proline--tRNA ligase [archaeon HR06]|nr:Proline--tRNA ligase [archaeon HR06]
MEDLNEEYTPGWKFNQWELKGVPLRIEIGPRDLANKQVVLARRDNHERIVVKEDSLVKKVKEVLISIQDNLFKRAKDWLEANTHDAKNMEEFLKWVEKGGFIRAPWCEGQDCEIIIKERTGADVRAIPLVRRRPNLNCIVCNKPAKTIAYFARAY